MSSAPLPCSRCRAGIPEEDLESGAAISVLGKHYCAACKGRAVQDISLDDLMEAHSPPPKPPPTASPASRPAPPRASPPPRRPETARLRVAQLRRPSKAPLVAGAAAGVVAIVVALVVVLRDPTPKPPVRPLDPAVATPDPPKLPADLRLEKAQLSYTSSEILARRPEAGFDDILASIEKSRPLCKGTPYEQKLEELRNRVLKEKDLVEGTRQLNPLVEELRAAVGSDATFARYAELVPKFEKARELAARASTQKLSEVTAIQQDYLGRYEKAAEPWYAEIREFAAQVADEKRYDLALKKIDTFPAHLRHSGAWKALEKLRQDVERRKASSK